MAKGAEYQHLLPIRKQVIAAKEFIRTGNATSAWKLINPDSKASEDSKRGSACKLFARPSMQKLVAALREKAFEQTRVSLAELVAENAAIVRFDPARIQENGRIKALEDMDPADRRCIQELKIDEAVSPDGTLTRTITVKRQEQRGAALDRLAKMMGAYQRDNEQKHAALEAVVTDELVLAQRIAFLLDKGLRAKSLPTTIEQST